MLVTFTEPVTAESRQNPANFTIVDDMQIPLDVLTAIDFIDEWSVMLTTDAQIDRPYLLHVSGVEDLNGNLVSTGLADTVTFNGILSATTGLGGDSRVGALTWMSAVPNPFRDNVVIDFGFDPQSSSQALARVKIRVFDAAGRLMWTLMWTLMDGRAESSAGRLTWDGRDGSGRRLPSGVYFLNLQAGEKPSQST